MKDLKAEVIYALAMYIAELCLFNAYYGRNSFLTEELLPEHFQRRT